jgi:hypothetical protein
MCDAHIQTALGLLHVWRLSNSYMDNMLALCAHPAVGSNAAFLVIGVWGVLWAWTLYSAAWWTGMGILACGVASTVHHAHSLVSGSRGGWTLALDLAPIAATLGWLATCSVWWHLPPYTWGLLLVCAAVFMADQCDLTTRHHDCWLHALWHVLAAVCLTAAADALHTNV